MVKKIEQLLKRVAYFIDTSEEELRNTLEKNSIWHKQFQREVKNKKKKSPKSEWPDRRRKIKSRIIAKITKW